MTRLFSTFPDGLPGAGLLLMRLATGATLLDCAFETWPPNPGVGSVLGIVQGLSAVSVLMGVLTPLGGVLAAGIESWRAVSQQDAMLAHALEATLAAALALLGPGAWSIDARLFGWRRIEVKSRRDQQTTQPKRVDHTHE